MTRSCFILLVFAALGCLVGVLLTPILTDPSPKYWDWFAETAPRMPAGEQAVRILGRDEAGFYVLSESLNECEVVYYCLAKSDECTQENRSVSEVSGVFYTSPSLDKSSFRHIHNLVPFLIFMPAVPGTLSDTVQIDLRYSSYPSELDFRRVIQYFVLLDDGSIWYWPRLYHRWIKEVQLINGGIGIFAGFFIGLLIVWFDGVKNRQRASANREARN